MSRWAAALTRYPARPRDRIPGGHPLVVVAGGADPTDTARTFASALDDVVLDGRPAACGR